MPETSQIGPLAPFAAAQRFRQESEELLPCREATGMPLHDRAPRGREPSVREDLTRIIVDRSGSWQAARRGNWPGRSPATKAALGDPAGRNTSEARAGLESDKADADPPVIWGRQHERGSNRHAHPLDPSG